MPPRASAAVFLALVASSGAPSPALAQVVREKVSVDVLTVRVAARDRSGRSVDDLTRADLSLTVDGKPVSIDTLSRPPASPGSPPDDAEPAMHSSPGLTPVRRIRTVVFVDEGETRTLDRRPVYAQLEQYVRDPGAGVRREITVARFDGDHMEIPCPWTDDPERAIAALRDLHRAPVFNRMPSASDLPGSGTPETWIEAYMARLHRALLEALAEFPDDPSDRQLLIVSGGTTLMRPMDIAAILRSDVTEASRKRLRGLEGDVSAAHAREIDRATFVLWSRAVNPAGDALTMSDVVAKAVERDVAIIPLAAEPIDRGFDLGIEHMRPSPAAAQFTPRLSVAQSMTEIAGNTGSEPILVPGKARERLSQIESRPVYSLTFRDPAGDHRYHRIELASRRRGVTLDYRRGYRLPGDDERMLDGAVARLANGNAGDAPDPLGARATLSAEPDERTSRLSVRIAPPSETTPAAERAVEVVGVGEDSAGQRTEPFSFSGTAGAVENEPGAYAVETRLRVRAGDFRWSLAVRDAATGLTSYVIVPASR